MKESKILTAALFLILVLNGTLVAQDTLLYRYPFSKSYRVLYTHERAGCPFDVNYLVFFSKDSIIRSISEGKVINHFRKDLPWGSENFLTCIDEDGQNITYNIKGEFDERILIKKKIHIGERLGKVILREEDGYFYAYIFSDAINYLENSFENVALH